MTKSSKFQSPYLEMKLLTNDEFQEYKNHSCKEYVRQGKTFKYDKDLLFLNSLTKDLIEVIDDRSSCIIIRFSSFISGDSCSNCSLALFPLSRDLHAMYTLPP